jgi:fructokinase
MENPKLLTIATAGEALIDLISGADGRYEPCLGGAVYNLTRALSRQGVGTLYLNPMSRDRFGRQLAAQLLGDGAVMAQPDPVGEATALAVVSLNTHGHPDYAFYREGVADRCVSAERMTAQTDAAGVQVVCTGALALDARDQASYVPWLTTQRGRGRLVVVDANLRPQVMPDRVAYRASIARALAQADIIKVSDEDLQHLGCPGASPQAQALALLADTQAVLVLLTLGEQGAQLIMRDGRIWAGREAAPVRVVDTVGAGDSFLAGFLARLLHELGASGTAMRPDGVAWADALAGLTGAQAQVCLAHGLASATLCVQERGCVPPDWPAVVQRLAQLPPAVENLSAG